MKEFVKYFRLWARRYRGIGWRHLEPLARDITMPAFVFAVALLMI